MLALILDDSRSSLAHLQRLLREVADIDMKSFLDPEEAIDAADRGKFDLVIVDHLMPRMDGIEFVRRLRAMPKHRSVPILMVTGSEDRAIRYAALEAGANDVLNKSPHPIELKAKIRNLMLIAEAAAVLDNRVTKLAEEVAIAVEHRLAREEEMIFRLSKAVEFRDNDTGDHTLRVANYSRMIAEELGLPPDLCRRIFLASPLHDLGKVAVPDQVLLKPGRLDENEMSVIRTHASIGAQILAGSTCETMKLAAEIAAFHHERWDGRGYPHGLAETAIPLGARIVAVADVFDALTTARPYKEAISQDEAFSYLRQNRGTQFDPECLDAFLRAMGSGSVLPLQACGTMSTNKRPDDAPLIAWTEVSPFW